MHWLEDMKHNEISRELNLPRATITRWFHRFKLPTQSCRRFTDRNLTSWLYKTGQLKKKVRYDGPDRRTQRVKIGVNVDFFKKWSDAMAYVLGYFAADGCMFVNPRGSRYVSFSSTDREILEKIKRIFKSQHKISARNRNNKNWKISYVLQIGSKEMYNDLVDLGFMPNKEARLKLPNMPKIFMRHFIRGYFDGDGSIVYGYYKRRNRNNKLTPYVSTCFAYANAGFLKSLSKVLRNNIGTHKGYLHKRDHLYYSRLDSIKIFHYIYKGVSKEFFLERKYDKFLKAINFGVVV